MQQPTANHQSETFGWGQTQYFECETLSADHAEIQARERARKAATLQSNTKSSPARTGRESGKVRRADCFLPPKSTNFGDLAFNVLH